VLDSGVSGFKLHNAFENGRNAFVCEAREKSQENLGKSDLAIW